MKRSLRHNPGNLLVEIDDAIVEEDKRLDVDEEPSDRKRKREEAAEGVDPFDDGVSLYFPAGALIIQERGTYVKEIKKLLLKDDKQYLGRMNLSQLQERTLAHLIEAAQATMICNDLVKAEASKAKAAKKRIEKLRVDHREKEKNLEERVKSMKKKADEFDELYNSKLSMELLLAAVQKENEELKAEKKKLSEERDELDAAVADTQMVGGLVMQKYLMKEYLEHRGTDWDPEEKIREINKVLAAKGVKTSDDENDEEKEEDEEREREDEDFSPPATGDDGDQEI